MKLSFMGKKLEFHSKETLSDSNKIEMSGNAIAKSKRRGLMSLILVPLHL